VPPIQTSSLLGAVQPVVSKLGGGVRSVKATDRRLDTDPCQSEAMRKETTIAVGTTSGLLLFGSQQTVEQEQRKVRALCPSGTDLWAVLDDHTVARRDSSGGWNTVAEVTDLRINCVLPYEGRLLAGTSRAHLLNIGNDETQSVIAFERAPGRDDWFTPWGGPPDIRSLDADGDHIYVNVHVGGILRSDSKLESWEPTLDINSDVHEVRVVEGSRGLLLAACSWGLAVSRDGGDSWDFYTEGMHAHYCRAVVACGDSILVTASLGPRGGRGAVYRCPLDKPEALEKCEAGLPTWFGDNIDTGCLTARDGTVAFGSGGDVFISRDAGATWAPLASDLPEVLGVTIFDAQ
jgi:hypothetical protein